MSQQRYYIAGDGTKYPLREAEFPFSFKVYRSDCRTAVIGDPFNCLIAKGGRRHKNVIALYIGSGKDAYVIMHDLRSGVLVAVHYTINARAAKVRDDFDSDKKLATQVITLSVPSNGRTLEHRRMLDKKRREAIKNGAPVTKRETQSITRVKRIGVKHRPHAAIKNNVVSMARDDEEAA